MLGCSEKDVMYVIEDARRNGKQVGCVFFVHRQLIVVADTNDEVSGDD